MRGWVIPEGNKRMIHEGIIPKDDEGPNLRESFEAWSISLRSYMEGAARGAILEGQFWG